MSSARAAGILSSGATGNLCTTRKYPVDHARCKSATPPANQLSKAAYQYQYQYHAAPMPILTFNPDMISGYAHKAASESSVRHKERVPALPAVKLRPASRAVSKGKIRSPRGFLLSRLERRSPASYYVSVSATPPYRAEYPPTALDFLWDVTVLASPPRQVPTSRCRRIFQAIFSACQRTVCVLWNTRMWRKFLTSLDRSGLHCAFHSSKPTQKTANRVTR